MDKGIHGQDYNVTLFRFVKVKFDLSYTSRELYNQK
ncbi:hypothetical protein Murru_1343 [Allomuricauda ruestringensis DSM 13258]|uniref:Uncharacterized protein n=1 Tax=Allomuricauda ruestringensis (strain DSM 13258 / CIP 107369 / LMG 19739 / B1) TaxID=886377 RepID=G2PPD3_ALLRU|nr:hypothetical protein Murru_1343 [Allomuricauda ruestringensis DSM 13258]